MSPIEPLAPWAESHAADSPLERQLSGLLRAAPEPAALPDAALQRVAYALRARAPRSFGLMLARLVAVGVVVGVAGAAGAQWAVVRLFGPRHDVAVSYAQVAAAPKPPAPPALPQSPRAAAPAEPTPVAQEPAASVAAAAVPSAAPAQSSPLGLEAASLEVALSALRAGGSGGAARGLLAIDQHLRAFPRGALELEARVARVDALLLLGRRQEARRELSALPIENVGRKNELRLIRAELRADGDCRAALSDFQVLVDASLAPAWAERALFGRGACLLELGDKAGAQRDFTRYLERFPAGRFAEQIRAQRPQLQTP
jgi:tetratricopeptide (TPR) repeat protein